MELNYQKRFQEMQKSTRRNQIEEIQKSFELSARNSGKEAQETSTLPELLICWRCGEMGHKKKEYTAILFCTNCGRNNHITSRCRQTSKENCVYCKRNDHTEEYCPAKRLDSFEQNQVREFQVHYGEQPRLQLAAGASRTEEYKTLAPNQYQWSQQVIEKGVTNRLASYRGFKNQGYDKPTRLQDGNVTTTSVNSNSSEISRAMEKISETNQLMAQQQIT